MTEIISLSALKEAYKQGLTNFEKEHITNYFYKNKNFFKIINYQKVTNLGIKLIYQLIP